MLLSGNGGEGISYGTVLGEQDPPRSLKYKVH